MVSADSNQPHPQRSSSPTTSISLHRRSGGPLLWLFHLLVIGVALAISWSVGPRVLAQGAPPVFQARTELVRLDVSVTDKNGRPVTDLRADEIEIAENGRRRPVVLFRHVAESRIDGDASAGTFEEVSRNEAASAGHLYVLVFDQLHMTPGHEQRARLAADRFLAGLKPGDAVAIYGLPAPGPALGFTADLIQARGRLRELQAQTPPTIGALREFDAYRVTRRDRGAAEGPDVSRPSDMFADPVAAGLAVGGTDVSAAGGAAREQATHVVAQADTRAHVFLTNLASVMRKLGVIDGRKTFVLFSDGFFADNLGVQIEHVASAAAQSNGTVYSIDLNTCQSSGVAMSAAEMAERRDPLARLATETDGRLVANASNLDEVLARIASETTDYYLVGFEPATADAAHDYHRVKVNVSRRDAVVRARTGYSTAPAETRFTERQAIDVALTVPRTCPAVPIEYTTYERIGEHADKPMIIASMTAHVPASLAANTRADVVFVVRDAVTGNAVASGTDQVPLAAGPHDAPGRLARLNYAVQFEVPPGEYWMRMLVREPGGVLGTADRRFHVWPIDSGTLTTSDLIVTRLAGAGFDPPSEAIVRPDDNVLAYVEVYGSEKVRAADTRVDVVHADRVVASADVVIKPGSAGETVVRARLPVSALGEGLYCARVRIAAGNQPARIVMRNFRVVAGEPHAQQ